MSTMNRSQVNTLIRDAEQFLEQYRFVLPPFSKWTPEVWQTKGPEAKDIVERGLGWDVTDFGSDDFDNVGLVVFTMRNGNPDDLSKGGGKLYAEKMLIINVNQHTPMHFHFRKTEDIINRGGGDLVIKLYNSSDDEKLADTEVSVMTDGVIRAVPAGGILRLKPGESITLPPYIYHDFWAEGERVLSGEVSIVNDDNVDNRFLEPAARYLEVIEDEPPLYPLCNETANFFEG